MLKKLILAAAGLALSAPVLADHGHRGYRHYHGNDYRHHYGDHRYVKRVVVHERHVVQRPVVVHKYHVHKYHHYRPAPQPVHVYHSHHSNAGPALLVGAIIGAAVVHSVVSSGY